MEDLNEQYFLVLRSYILDKEDKWKNKEISNQEALKFFEEKNIEVFFFVRNNKPSHLRTKMSELLEYINNVINQIKEEMKNVYVIHTNNNETIVCADESLIKKCLERLGTNVSSEPIKTKIYQSEEDLDEILPKKEEPSLKGDFVYFEFHGV